MTTVIMGRAAVPLVVLLTGTPVEQSPRIFPTLNRYSRASFEPIRSISGSPTNTGFPGVEKGAAGSGGRAGRARTRSGDGEGGRDRGRVAPVWARSARGCCGDRGTRIAEPDPGVGIVLRL